MISSESYIIQNNSKGATKFNEIYDYILVDEVTASIKPGAIPDLKPTLPYCLLWWIPGIIKAKAIVFGLVLGHQFHTFIDAGANIARL